VNPKNSSVFVCISVYISVRVHMRVCAFQQEISAAAIITMARDCVFGYVRVGMRLNCVCARVCVCFVCV